MVKVCITAHTRNATQILHTFSRKEARLQPRISVCHGLYEKVANTLKDKSYNILYVSYCQQIP